MVKSSTTERFDIPLLVRISKRQKAGIQEIAWRDNITEALVVRAAIDAEIEQDGKKQGEIHPCENKS